MIVELIILILISLLSIILLKKNFELALKILLVFSVLLHKEVFSFYKWDFLPIRFFMLALLLFSVVSLFIWIVKKRDFKAVINFIKDPFILIMLGLWVVRGVSIIYSKNINASILLFGFFTTIVALGFLLYVNLKSKTQNILTLIKNYIFIAFIISLFGYFQLYLYTTRGVIIGALWNVPGHLARVGSTFWDVNHFGALLASLLPVVGVLVLVESSKLKKTMYTVAFFVMTATLGLTSSRTAWIAAGVAFLSFITLLLVRKIGRKGISIIFAALILLSIPLAIEYSNKASPFRAYVKANFHYRLDSFASHLMLLKGSYQIFEQYPILGGGYGSFFEHFRKTEIAAEFFGRDPAALNTRVPAHTIWGEAIADTGVLGLSLQILFSLLFIAVMSYGFFNIHDKRDYLMLGAMLSTYVGLLFAGIFYSYNSEFYWIILFLYFLYSISVIGVGSKISYIQIFDYFIKEKSIYPYLVGVIAFFLIFVGLGTNHLIPWDEAIYAKIAKNMVVSGDFINMTWKNAAAWFEKPPLYIWSIAVGMKLFGFSAVAARLPSALFGFGTVLLTYFIANKYFGKFAAAISALALATGVHFLYYSRTAMTDVATTFFITASLFVYLKTVDKSKLRCWFIVGALSGLAVMMKGVVGFLPLPIIGFIELTRGKKIFSIENLKNYLTVLIGLVIIVAPWHIVMYQKHGQAFIDNYFFYHVLSRATQDIEDKGRPFFWYLTVMKVSMRIWFIPLIAAFPFFIYKAVKKESNYLMFVIWAVFIFLFFSASKSKIVWYILPIYPVVSIMVGHFCDYVYRFVAKRIKILNHSIIEFFVFFIISTFSLMYLFFNRHMVYTEDLTGPQANLLMLRDVELGTDELLYVDRIELPLIIYYTDGPFEVVDYAPSKMRIPLNFYDKDIHILTKIGRFNGGPNLYGKEPIIIGQEGDYILVSYKSDMSIDKQRLKEIDKILKNVEEGKEQSITNTGQLEKEREEIVKRILVFEPI